MKREYTTWSHALDIVKHDKTYNMLVRLGTLWNVLSLDALVLSLRDKGITVNALVIITEHPTNGYLVDESCFVNDCYTFVYLPANEPDKDSANKISEFSVMSYYRFLLKKRSLDNGLMVVTFNHTMPDVVIAASVEPYVGRDVVPCRIEEGFAAYSGTYDKTYPDLKRIHSVGELRSFIRYIVFGRWFYRLLHPSFDSLTLRQSLFGLKINKGILPFYREVFAKRTLSMDAQFDWTLLSHSIVICTVGWHRDKIQNDEDFRVWKEVCDYLYSLGYSLILKPHPRDTFFEHHLDALHCTLMKIPGMSMESMCTKAQPRAVISFSSTTLVNPKVFWNIPTYSIVGLLDRSKIDEMYLDEADNFRQTFGNIVTFIDHLQDISIEK